MPATWYESTVTRIETVAPSVRRFFLTLPDETAVSDFKAGQFLTIDLPIGEKRLHRWRSYSVANLPDTSEGIELCIVRSAEGLGTKFLFESVNEGSVLRWKGPDGGFVLPEHIDKDLVLICTGTGIAPFRSMLRDLQRNSRPHRNIHLIFGARYESDILYRAEFEALTRTLPGFRYDVALSRQHDWAGQRGYVHPIYMDTYREPRPDVAFYVCGWSNMIDEAVANLIGVLRYDRSQVHYELYG
jgi:ferredoxin-NADP reductase